MKLYLDEDSSHGHLLGLLRSVGHAVLIPADVGMLGKRDPRQLLFAFGQQRVFLSRNHRDFVDLHEMLIGCGGAHFGILTIREEKDRKRSMKPHHIVRAIQRLTHAGVLIASQHYVLNQWR